MSDLLLARRMGWTYDEVRALPRDVYDVLLEELNTVPAPPPTEGGQ